MQCLKNVYYILNWWILVVTQTSYLSHSLAHLVVLAGGVINVASMCLESALHVGGVIDGQQARSAKRPLRISLRIAQRFSLSARRIRVQFERLRF